VAECRGIDNRYTGVFEQIGEWWIGHVEELPGCNVQEPSLEEARESLKQAIQLIVQANRELARRESEGHTASARQLQSRLNEAC
jgi:predicted RNase H-like HicB family nuclease